MDAKLVNHFRTFPDAELLRFFTLMPSPDPDQGQYDREENLPALMEVLRERGYRFEATR